MRHDCALCFTSKYNVVAFFFVRKAVNEFHVFQAIFIETFFSAEQLRDLFITISIFQPFPCLWLLGRSMSWLGSDYAEQLRSARRQAVELTRQEQGSDIDEKMLMETFLTPDEQAVIHDYGFVALEETLSLSVHEEGEASCHASEIPASHAEIDPAQPAVVPPASEPTESVSIATVYLSVSEYNPDDPGLNISQGAGADATGGTKSGADGELLFSIVQVEVGGPQSLRS